MTEQMKNWKKMLWTSLLYFGGGILLSAQQPALKFNADKKFKIIQFTDVHYIDGDPRSAGSLENIAETLDAEKPDLVIITGDVIYGKPAEAGMRAVLRPISERKIPFAVTYGNHDDEFDMTREELFTVIQSVPYNLTATAEDIHGVTNFILPILSATSGKTAELLYCFDSNAYSKLEDVKGYDYIRADQIAWYRTQSESFTRANGGVPIPSLAFFHIPFPEFNQASSDEHAHFCGTRMEAASSPKLNSGMFVAMKEMKDIEGVFVGHDHDNDYAVQWHGILLAFGRYSGGNTVYNNLKPNGARIIELTEGVKGFRTYIHLRGGAIINDLKYPEYFTDQKN